ncbi:hypothetical protein K492DRAFT_177412 [Lichtheimia hyalospora FSU 10163]|nr:hypothetical protein K492DRAFT_177412 [Lichtheimia hyalospora FSU 10163]
MGGFLSKQQTKSDDYEKILSELDDKIQTAEIRLSEIKLRERRTGLLWILYSSIIWVAFLLYSFVVLYRPDKDIYTWDTLAVTVVPVLVIPIGIYYTRRLLKLFYSRKQTNEESNLAALRAQQKLKLEELKKKTSYYTTKSLLERYDLTAAAMERRKQQQQQQQAQRPASMPTSRPNQPGPNQELRHRVPPSKAMQQPGGGQQQPMQPQQPSMMMSAPRPIAKERQWYDKLVDALVGEEGPETKYALICQHCFAHNGLVLPQEIAHIQYTCPHCKQFNPARNPNASTPIFPPSSSTRSQSTPPAEPTLSEGSNSKEHEEPPKNKEEMVERSDEDQDSNNKEEDHVDT